MLLEPRLIRCTALLNPAPLQPPLAVSIRCFLMVYQIISRSAISRPPASRCRRTSHCDREPLTLWVPADIINSLFSGDTQQWLGLGTDEGDEAEKETDEGTGLLAAMGDTQVQAVVAEASISA